MFGKISLAKKNTFEQDIAAKQSKKLQENLEKLAVPADEQEKIMKMRNNSSDEYRKERCFWFLENHTIPKSKTKYNQHHFETFEKCQRELSEALGEKTEEQKPESVRFGFR
ncbi:hypothetical protein [Legionella qingyii]|nr:hypothetical protein [Legionella qingyii]RUR25894.1 hypothetical protein ELY20_01735 [Legionella qingyii]RUR29284.1 hypothetical protein ELY16_00360 [Legionella qingyii]